MPILTIVVADASALPALSRMKLPTLVTLWVSGLLIRLIFTFLLVQSATLVFPLVVVILIVALVLVLLLLGPIMVLALALRWVLF